jgi:hypothetical protein
MSAAWRRANAPRVDCCRAPRAKSEPVRRRWRLPWYTSTSADSDNSTGCPPTPWSADSTPHAWYWQSGPNRDVPDAVHRHMLDAIQRFARGLAAAVAGCQLVDVARRCHAASAMPRRPAPPAQPPSPPSNAKSGPREPTSGCSWDAPRSVLTLVGEVVLGQLQGQY